MRKHNSEDGDAQRTSPSSVPEVPGDAVPPPSPARPSAIRERLLRATIDVVSTMGYEATVIGQIVEASGLSRTVLYRRLGGKQGAVVEAGRQILDGLTFAVDTALAKYDEHHEAGRPAVPPVPQPSSKQQAANRPAIAREVAADRAVAGLTALMEALAADPPAAAVLVLEAPVAGHAARALRCHLLTLIAAVVGDLGAPAATTARSSPLAWTSEMRAGAVHAILLRRISRGHTADLPALVPALVATLSALPA